MNCEEENLSESKLIQIEVVYTCMTFKSLKCVRPEKLCESMSAKKRE